MSRNVLIAGSSSGIGLALARQLNADGFLVYAGAQSFIKGEYAPDGYRLLTLDVTDDSSVQAAIDIILKRGERMALNFGSYNYIGRSGIKETMEAAHELGIVLPGRIIK